NDNKIGIDGGAVYGGYLYGVILDVHGIQDYVYV
ncbi:serine/threonine protein phosphatase, partial [Macrococcoides caseolyticum]